MVEISVQKPTGQPTGQHRLLDELRTLLADASLEKFSILVAFAKVGPLLRLEQEIDDWNEAGKTIHAIIGVDSGVTSEEALRFASSKFEEAHVASAHGAGFGSTFHPKVYLFEGAEKAIAFVGSNNLTVGGTETNLETFLRIDMVLPEDQGTLDQIREVWNDALSVALELDDEIISDLRDSKLVHSERRSRTGKKKEKDSGEHAATSSSFPSIQAKPPSPVPKGSLAKYSVEPEPGPGVVAEGEADPSDDPAEDSALAAPVEALVIQVTPHHNGEVFLSKSAIDQNPVFFGWPFTGLTTPKKPSNPPYPQRDPDPVVDLRVYDANGALAISLSAFDLNTVYYEPKSEIRITVPQEVVAATPEHSVMVIYRAPDDSPLDYVIDIFVPESQEFDDYLAICDQTMPSGGKPTARRFGWL